MSKWPGIAPFFEETESDGSSTNFTFKCVLCAPRCKYIKASVTSASNLRTHVKVSSGQCYISDVLTSNKD